MLLGGEGDGRKRDEEVSAAMVVVTTLREEEMGTKMPSTRKGRK